ncbi:NAD(P)-binding protein [Hypoxylon sp. EC38]|nr:NAD(P)-binding protein [Hypoxylon sp. EC38]
MSATNDLSFYGKVAIITGSGRPSGIGAAIAVALAVRGACVTINYVSDSSAPRAAELAESIRARGGKATVVRGDVGDPEVATKLVKETLAAFNTDKIDILTVNKSTTVNNAGIAPMTPTVEVTPEEMSSVFRTNVWGPLLLVQAALPYMPRGGRIINISTCLSRMGLHSPVYSASKAALDSLTYTWALEFGRKFGITVNAIAPGLTKTEICPPDDHPEVQRMLGLTRLEGRMGTIEEIADAVVLIASPLSGWVTGQYISVSGGVNWI